MTESPTESGEGQQQTSDTARPAPGQVVVQGGAQGFEQHVQIGEHALIADEPIEVGGGNRGPGPYDLLLASLGTCTSMTLAMYARRKQWPLEGVRVSLQHSRVHARDCMDCETKQGMLDHVECEIELTGPLSGEQRARLLEIANKCPVHRSLSSEIVIATRLR